MEVKIEICDICGQQHDTRYPLNWESIYTSVKIGLSYDGQNLPHVIPHVCRKCREVLTDAVNAAIELRAGLKVFPSAGLRRYVDPEKG